METVLEAEWILRQNTPYSGKRELMELLEDSRGAVHSSMLDMLYKQVNEVRKIDFAEIAKSKGNAASLSFSKEIEQAFDSLAKSGKCVSDLSIVKDAWTNINRLTKSFSEGYKLNADLVMLTYESMVMAVLDGTSVLITRTASAVVKTKEKTANVSINVLARFNTAVKKGTVTKMIQEVNKGALALSGGRSVSKEDFGVTLALGSLAAAAIAIIPLVRELVFYFYFTRMKIANYLDQLKLYVQINEVEIKNNKNFDSEKKKSIIEKQNSWIEKLDKVSDFIRVQQSTGEKSAKTQIKKGNSELTLDNVKNDIASNSGFDFE